MKSTIFTVALLSALTSVLASVDPPDSVNLIRPDPNILVPQYTNLTFGFTTTSTQLFGLIQNVDMSYRKPDGSTVQGASFGPKGATFQSDGYSPQECRTFPGVSTINEVNATQVGNYTFMWDVTYVMSSDPSQANSSSCGPPPFSKQEWSLTSNVSVIDADLGTAVVAATASTTVPLPGKPTGKVNNGAKWTGGTAYAWSTATVMFIGLGMAVVL